jgi:hypothetical protein
MSKARVTCYLSDYPHITQSFEFDYDEEDAYDYGNIEDALYDWAHEEIGKNMIFEWKVEKVEAERPTVRRDKGKCGEWGGQYPNCCHQHSDSWMNTPG